MDILSEKKQILLVEGESGLRAILNILLAHAGYSVFAAAHGREAIRIMSEETIDLLITDLVTPEKQAIDTVRTIRRRQPHLPIIAVAGIDYGPAGNYLGLAKAAGVDKLFVEPFHYSELMHSIADILGDCQKAPRAQKAC